MTGVTYQREMPRNERDTHVECHVMNEAETRVIQL